MNKEEIENKMLDNAELDGSLGDYGNYSVDYADGKVIAEVMLVHDFGHVDAEAKVKVGLEAKDIIMAWVKSTDTEVDDAIAALLFEKLKI